MITVRNRVENGDEYKGVEVIYDEHGKEEGPAKVTVDCHYPPLAIELLEHAIVAMRSRQRLDESFQREMEDRRM